MLHARQAVAGVVAKSEICSYIGKIVRLTREMGKVLMGASSRAAVHLLQAAKVKALMAGRDFVSPDDVKSACRPVLRHRVSANFQAQAEGRTSDDIVLELLKIVSDPEPPKYGAGKKR